MPHPFTPQSIIRQRRYQVLAGLLVLVIVAVSTNALFLPNSSSATTTTDWQGSGLDNGSHNQTMLNGADEVSLAVEGSVTDDDLEAFLSGYNLSNPFAMTAWSPENEGIEINQGYAYPQGLDPGGSYSSFLDNNLLYLSTNEGVWVINTQGTVDPNDDVLVVVYDTSSTPALAADTIYSSVLYANLLYISTLNGGLSVINTQGTVDPGDDTLVTRYHTGSTPALASNRVLQTQLIDNLLYIVTYGGLSVIDTQGTVDSTDDTLVTRYHTGSTPALASNQLRDVQIIEGILYISTRGGGLSVINTQGTVDPTDDTLVTRYYTGSTPALLDDRLESSSLVGNLLYIASDYNGGLAVIDTKGTLDPSDDTSEIYTSSSSPISFSFNTSIFPNSVTFSQYDTDDGYLYIAHYGAGLYVVDTKMTNTNADNTLVTHYYKDSNPSITSGILTRFFRANDHLYISSYDSGLNVITPDLFRSAGSFESLAQPISTTPTTTIVMDSTVISGQSADLSYRSGATEAVWRDDFNSSSSYAGDLYGWAWGTSFNTIEAVDGVLRLTDLADPGESVVNFWIDPGFPIGHFATSSILTARVRMSGVPESTLLTMFNDDFWESDADSVVDEWIILRFKSQRNLTHIGLQFYNDLTSLSPTTTLEIDWIQVTTPDSQGEWNPWNSCGDTCILPDLATSSWLQYKLDLTTSNQATSPVVHSVTYQGDYLPTGTYTSETETFKRSQELLTFNANVATSASTSVSFEYSTNGTTWSPINPGDNFPQNTVTSQVTWRATLTTSDPRYTPTINSVSITSATVPKTQATSIPRRVAALEAEGKSDQAAELRAKYPDLFNPDGTPRSKEVEIVVLLSEAAALLERLIQQKNSE